MHLTVIVFKPERKLVLKYFSWAHQAKHYPVSNAEERLDALRESVQWLLNAQKVTVDHGFASYHLAEGWSASYPETTGYIIPTLINYGKRYNNQGCLDAIVKAADFLVGIQEKSGGWQGGRVGDNRPEIVFNTGQVIRGMISAYELTRSEIYLKAAFRAGEWLASVQHPEGYWKTNALMDQARVYDTFVDAPLVRLSEITGEELFREAALRNLDWVVNSKIHPNGWTEDCDNTLKHNDRPILHTIAYTLDGLIDCGLRMGKEKYVEAAVPASAQLCDLFLSKGILHGRYDHSWHGQEHFICTGGAQMAIIWLKLFRSGQGEKYLNAANRMIDLLIYIQSLQLNGKDRTRGGIPGSFPIWGRYEPFAFPNWASKFFCDAILLEEDISK